MSAKKSEIQERKDTVLGIVVDEYIHTVTPVSSGLIAHQHHLELSPASIRNILAELEEEGFLTHPHTSAGRIPTQRGYRYYVDKLMNQIQLLEEEKQHIRSEYNKKVSELEKLLEKTSEVISDVTHYTSIVSVDGEQRIFCRGTSFVVSYPESQSIQKIRDILGILEEKEQLLEIINRDLEHRVGVFIGKELACSSIDDCSLVISTYETEGGTTGRLAVLGPTRMNYQRVVSALDYLTDLMRNV